MFDYQIIIIDDGSKDNTPAILDELAKKNDRLIVLHKENGGPAAARKYGIDNSNSDYLAFCDADDYVDSDWLFTMYKYLKQYDADISRIMAYINDNIVESLRLKPYSVDAWNRDEALEKYLEHKELNGSLVTCLVKRKLFEHLDWNIQMHYYEDDFLMWQMLQNVNTFVKVHAQKYHYMFYSNSLTNSSYNINRYISSDELLQRVLSDCTKKEMQLHLESAKKMVDKWKFRHYYMLVISCLDTKEMQYEIRNTLLQNFSKYMGITQNLKEKITLFTMIISPRLTRIVYRLFKH